ncbi:MULTISPECIES: hypothetical protein [unclassified Pseudomonas]|uniref:hypothetical protein n=1 Tax=unclassified Pseudomonas TaxID=196821 RepID=UPI000BC60A9D|nr:MULTISPECIES: hypothetical protein [unclassified Pseudomonas]PVZ10507.1 hypothetical protein F474_04097 [Pseudomonas sp. URIL14HWK12:I12]PVZ21933.1 hypothetical protein F470_04097 [Pseudomonas sp. URIL14HWK12:I10]PVZ30984.1 hypothetical protein F472_04001 [Pseudomonas sp. URIL14HWK12:I11]SNZ17485.1 hypothetical protein SAMN05660463_03640 [Pseudomonas sp. URIL14HWK12:I9]
MHNHNLFPEPISMAVNDEIESCLSINTPDAQIGLMNLLDLVDHQITKDNGGVLHTLSFRNGHRLKVFSDGTLVTVVGKQINFHPSEIYPFNTLLAEPGAKP